MRGRWSSHLGDFVCVDDDKVVKAMLRSNVTFENQSTRFYRVVNDWTVGAQAFRRIQCHSDGAITKSFVTLQLPHPILNLMMRAGLRHLVTAFPTKRKAKTLRAWMGLPHDPSDSATIFAIEVQKQQEVIIFDPKYFDRAISITQGDCIGDGEEDLDHIPVQHVVSWLRTLKRHSLDGPQNLSKSYKSVHPMVGYRMEALIIAVRIAGLLRADSQLKLSLCLNATFLENPDY